MDDIISYKLNPLLDDYDFFNGLSLCSRNKHMMKMRNQRFKYTCAENLNEIIMTSFYCPKNLIRNIQYKNYMLLINDDQDDDYHSTYMFQLVKYILRNINKKYSFHDYDFEDYDKINNKTSNLEMVKCVNSYHCIGEIIYFRYYKADFINDYDITYMELNTTYRIPQSYMKLFKNHYRYAYALIY